jgi:uncharacterized protein
MRVVVAGGTGFIGKRLVRVLRARGDDVTVLSRATHAPAHGEKHARWDPTPSASPDWMTLIDGADAVVNLAGAPIVDQRWTAARLELLRSSRVDSTRLVCQAIAEASRKPGVLVNASAVGFYGMHAEGPTFDESSPPGDDVLGKMCVAWEAATQGGAERVALARIGIVLGDDGGALAKMLPAFRAFVGGPIGSGRQALSWVHHEDCVRALVFAIDRAEVRGPFNVCSPNPSTMTELASAIGSALHRPSLFRVPGFVLRATMGDRADAILTGQRAVPSVLTGLGFTFAHPTLDEAVASIV